MLSWCCADGHTSTSLQVVTALWNSCFQPRPLTISHHHKKKTLQQRGIVQTSEDVAVSTNVAHEQEMQLANLAYHCQYPSSDAEAAHFQLHSDAYCVILIRRV